MTVWSAAVIALVALSASIAVAYGTAVVGRHRAGTAADLAALAAAVRVVDGATGACRTAAAVAARNGGVLRGCRLAGTDVEVSVARSVRLAGLGMRTVVVRARAGPVTP